MVSPVSIHLLHCVISEEHFRVVYTVSQADTVELNRE